MPLELDEKVAAALTAPPKGQVIHYDKAEKGFGLRVTAAGAKSFILNYRTRAGQERRYTIGAFPGWSVKAARKEAGVLKARIRTGDDPLESLEAERRERREQAALATMNTLCDRFEALHLPKLRPTTDRDYRSIIRLYIRPELGHLKVREVTFAHVERLHRAVTKRAPRRANLTVSVLSKMFAFAARTPAADDVNPPVPMRPDGINPAAGIERNPERKVERYLSGEEIAALTKALAAHEDQQAANIIRLLILTGARKGEVLSARWEQFDLQAGVWTKPGATTKQKTTHRVPLSKAACELLEGIKNAAETRAKEKGGKVEPSDFVFPGRTGGHRVEIKAAWRELCVAAGLVARTEVRGADGLEVRLTPTARIHDLRHTYASLLVSSGLSLPIVGALLGHTQPATTHRYSHLMDNPLRAATEHVGALVMPTAPVGDQQEEPA